MKAKQTTMNAAYNNEAKLYTFFNGGNSLSVKVLFTDAPPYEGPSSGLIAHCKAQPGFKCHISESKVDGTKMGVFWTFTPTTQRERDWLAAKTGQEIGKGRVYTWATRYSAVQNYQELVAAGIPTNDANWSMGSTSRSAVKGPVSPV